MQPRRDTTILDHRAVGLDPSGAQANLGGDVDNSHVQQVFGSALLINAMQAMPGGGDLTFESSANEDTAEIRVMDTGTGIAQELRDKIFRLQ